MGHETTLDPSAPLVAWAATGSSSRLVAIYEIGRELLEQHEPGQVMRKIHEAILAHLRPDHFCVLSIQPDGGYQPVTSHNLDLVPGAGEWPLSHTVLDRTRASGLALLSFDAEIDSKLSQSGSVKRLRIDSVMCVPLGRKPVRGLVYADVRGKKRAFNQEDLAFLTALSVYASLILQTVEECVRTSEALKLSDERLELLQGELLRYRIVGNSPRLLAAYDSLRRLARAGARVLLRGETGTGKELFARAYAATSSRRGKAYVPVPIPALTPTLVESELFGHVKGAFTEASRDKKGRLELAHGGVLFLDEVGDIELPLQAKLLRFLDSGELYRVGDTAPRWVDALLVSATNRPLENLVVAERFRADLLARLGHVITIPPLRERPEDIPLLVGRFIDQYDSSARKKIFSPEALAILQRYRWPLNVRELQQVVEWTAAMVDRDVVTPVDLPEFVRRDAPSRATKDAGLANSAGPPRSLKEVVEEAEKAHILRALEFTHGNKRKAIEILQIASDTFYKRLHEFGLKKD